MISLEGVRREIALKRDSLANKAFPSVEIGERLAFDIVVLEIVLEQYDRLDSLLEQWSADLQFVLFQDKSEALVRDYEARLAVLDWVMNGEEV